MPKYNFLHEKCKAISEHIVPRIMVEDEEALLICDKCGHIDMLKKVTNTGLIMLQGCSHPKENG